MDGGLGAYVRGEVTKAGLVLEGIPAIVYSAPALSHCPGGGRP